MKALDEFFGKSKDYIIEQLLEDMLKEYPCGGVEVHGYLKAIELIKGY